MGALGLPRLCRLISAIPPRVGKKLAAVMAVFLAVSTVLSAAALYRMDQRREGRTRRVRLQSIPG